MTRERDRIQENANKYIVKNCPCLKSQISYKDKLWVNGCSELGEVGSRMCCQDITNCVIKQVVEKCKVVYNTERLNRYKTNGFILANDILQLFDIKEILE